MKIPKKETKETVKEEAIEQPTVAIEPKKTSVYDMLIEQINKEQYSMLVYEALASWCNYNDWINVSNWLYKKAAEEYSHKMKLVKYINDRGWEVLIKGDETPNIKPNYIKDVFNLALEHERSVTQSLTDIQVEAESTKDRMTYNFMDWYLQEQIEEEAVLIDYIANLELSNDKLVFDLMFKN